MEHRAQQFIEYTLTNYEKTCRVSKAHTKASKKKIIQYSSRCAVCSRQQKHAIPQAHNAHDEDDKRPEAIVRPQTHDKTRKKTKLKGGGGEEEEEDACGGGGGGVRR